MTENQALLAIAEVLNSSASTIHATLNSNAERLNNKLDGINKELSFSASSMDDIRSSIDKNTEALQFIAQILRNK